MVAGVMGRVRTKLIRQGVRVPWVDWSDFRSVHGSIVGQYNYTGHSHRIDTVD